MQKCKSFLLAIFLLNLLWSCNKDVDLSGVQDSTLTVDPELKLMFSHFGYDSSQITKVGADYLVEGDLLFTELQVQELESKMELSTSRQRKTLSCIPFSETLVTDIFFGVRASDFPGNWLNAFSDAVDQWNSISGSSIELSWGALKFGGYNSSLPNHVLVESRPSSSGADAWVPGISNCSSLPSYIAVRDSLIINSTGWGLNHKIGLFVHEIGHIIGMHHTNGSSGVYISGTCSSDASSFINNPSFDSDPSFSSCDLTAILTLYPD